MNARTSSRATFDQSHPRGSSSATVSFGSSVMVAQAEWNGDVSKVWRSSRAEQLGWPRQRATAVCRANNSKAQISSLNGASLLVVIASSGGGFGQPSMIDARNSKTKAVQIGLADGLNQKPNRSPKPAEVDLSVGRWAVVRRCSPVRQKCSVKMSYMKIWGDCITKPLPRFPRPSWENDPFKGSGILWTLSPSPGVQRPFLFRSEDLRGNDPNAYLPISLLTVLDLGTLAVEYSDA